MVTLWTPGIPFPQLAAPQAQWAEAAGYDGLLFVDSQNLAPDTYVGLALAAQASTRLQLGTGVTNPFTRHPAVTASAIATVQSISDGRAVLGIGRGDSALAYLGLAPAPVAVLEHYLTRLQSYLRGEEVAVEADGDVRAIADGRLPLRVAPASRIEWLGALPKVPVDVAATGPRVIALAARLAERVTFAVGADVGRVKWAIESARAARADAGLDPDDISFGAYVNVVAHPEPRVARELATPALFSFARFSAMHGTATGPLGEADRALLERIAPSYDMTRHVRRQDAQADILTDDFVDRFGVVGPPARCIERLQELVALGLDRLVIIGPGFDVADAGARGEATRCFNDEVAPALR
jgi:5,10-methylenetetrahydromethanopterin reductase